MECAFHKEADWGEIFIEFDEQVMEHKLLQSLEVYGASSVTTQTFTNNDKGDSAAAALLRIRSQVGNKGWTLVTRGTCPPALQAKVLEKQSADKTNVQEFDAKTKEAIARSLALQEDTNAKVVSVGTDVEQIKDGVCGVIPDYQRKIEELERVVAHKTKECDRIEFAKAQQTRKLNESIVALKMAVEELNTSNSALARLKLEMESKNDMYTRIIKIDGMLSDFISEERAMKRPRDA